MLVMVGVSIVKQKVKFSSGCVNGTAGGGAVVRSGDLYKGGGRLRGKEM